MSLSARKELYPGKPRILFIGLAESSHTQAWMGLLDDAALNVRLFATLHGSMFSNWPSKTIFSASPFPQSSSPVRRKLAFVYDKLAQNIGFLRRLHQAKLASVIKRWRPDIIHTLGLFDGQGGEFYLEARQRFHLVGYGKWVLQLRGGSDMALRRHNPEFRGLLQQALSECDQIICDNRANVQYAAELGISADKFAHIVPVPGSGGIDVSAEATSNLVPPSRRERIILWPKAYESQWSKALPVLEAIQRAWKEIQPCEIYMLAVSPDVYEWYLCIPGQIREHLHVKERIPRREVLSLMRRARILLAPSLVDGVPNSLYEAMSSGAFPIVSPLETIMPVVSQEENVLFARNLYPDEIASALICAMQDDALVDKAAENNSKLVQRIANRQTIRTGVIKYYEELASG